VAKINGISEMFTVCMYQLRSNMTKKKVTTVVILFIALLFVINGAGFLQFLAFIFWAFRPSIPITLLIPYYAMVALMPVIAIVVTHNLFAGEIEQKTVRFVITKIRRSSYLAGKLLATVIVHVVIIFLIVLISFLYTYYQIRQYFVAESFLIFFALVAYSISLISLYSFISVFSGKSEKSLQLSIVATIILAIFIMISSLQKFSPMWYAKQVFVAPHIAFFFWIAVAMTMLSGSVVLLERKQL
jgi:ABC-type transport system involved in multi-copper enzyme maturation permease subunit